MERKKILVAVDGSSYSEKVLSKAIELVKLLDGQIVFVYCHKKYPKIVGYPYRDKIISSINDEAEKIISPFLERMKKENVPYIERLMEEPAGTMIPTVAENEQCELIIMGSRGLSNLQGLIVGSVTQRVLHLAECPVFVIK